MQYKWPLSIPQFSLTDKIKLVKFLLTNDRWTHGEIVETFEKEMAKYIRVKYAVFTSSGSTANTILAMKAKEDNISSKRKVVVFPSTTWITSVSPWIREGFTPYFIDINLEDFSIDLSILENYLKDNAEKVACVFITSLIGYTPEISQLKFLAQKYNIKIMMDNCENTFGKYDGLNVSSFFTSTTSTYFGHQLQSIEGGFIFTNDDDENDYYLMCRNHGMLRHLKQDRRSKYRNEDVDEFFDFAILGNNFRNTNINAFLGNLDLKRADKYFHHRRKLYDIFKDYLSDYCILPNDTLYASHAPFCLPIIPKPIFKYKIPELKKYCSENGIEKRPIISGNLLRQTCIKSISKQKFNKFPNSEYLHNNGFYIGLHGSTKVEDVHNLSIDLFGVIDEPPF